MFRIFILLAFLFSILNCSIGYNNFQRDNLQRYERFIKQAQTVCEHACPQLLYRGESTFLGTQNNSVLCVCTQNIHQRIVRSYIEISLPELEQ